MSAVDIKNLSFPAGGQKHKVPYTILKAFTSNPSAGNPAAVVVLPAASSDAGLKKSEIKQLYPSDDALLALAREFNLPMTALLVPTDPKAAKYALRWWYPAGEAELCGHATMALSAHLFSSGHAPDVLELETVFYGTMRTRSVPNPWKPEEKVVALDFPELLGFKEQDRNGERFKEVVQRLTSAIPNVKAEDVVRIDETPGRMLVHISESNPIKDLNIQPAKLNPKSEKSVFPNGQCLIPYQIAPESDEQLAPQLFSRYLHTDPAFAEEDAATGSAHCAIIPHVLTDPACLELLRKNHPSSDFGGDGPLSKTVRVRQVSKEVGEMMVEWRKEEHVVRIMGTAVEIKKGEVEI